MSNRNTRGAVVSYNVYTRFHIFKNHFVWFIKRSKARVTSYFRKNDWMLIHFITSFLSHLYLTAELQWKLKDIPEVKSPCFFLHLFVSVFIFCVLCSSFLPMSMNRWKKKRTVSVKEPSLNDHAHITEWKTRSHLQC